MPFRHSSWLCTSSPCLAILYSSDTIEPSVTRLLPFLAACSSRPFALRGPHGSRAVLVQQAVWEARQGTMAGGMTNALLCLILAKNHSPHLCSCSTLGMSGAESQPSGGSAPPGPALSLPYRQERSDCQPCPSSSHGQPCPLLLSSSF